MQAQLTSDPILNLLAILSATLFIDGIILYYVYRKNKLGLGFKISFLVLLSALIPNIANSVAQFFESNAIIFQLFWGGLSIIVMLITIIYVLNNIISPINSFNPSL